MTLLGIGIDLLYLPRLRALIQRRKVGGGDRLARRILGEQEQADYRALSAGGSDGEAKLRFLAVR